MVNVSDLKPLKNNAEISNYSNMSAASLMKMMSCQVVYLKKIIPLFKIKEVITCLSTSVHLMTYSGRKNVSQGRNVLASFSFSAGIIGSITLNSK